MNITEYNPLLLIKNKIKNKLVFDIGANKGYTTLQFIECGAKVIAVEPQIIVKNSNYGSAIVLNICISDYNGNVDFHIGDMSPLSSCNSKWNSVGPYKFRWKQIISVPCRTLDSMISEFGEPYYIKIDVEGYENVVLRGLIHIILFR